MAQSDLDQKALMQAFDTLCKEQKTLLLSSVCDSGEPLISYCPFWRGDNGWFYIFVSDLAEHSKNLQRQSSVSVMILRDESESRNLFARERASWLCEVVGIDRNSEEAGQILDQFENRQGATVKLLRGLSDFNLYGLKPVSGRYVMGFGKAFELDLINGGFMHLNS